MTEQTIHYAIEEQISVEEFIQILKDSTLLERRPLNSPERLKRMIEQADVIVTARTGDGRLVGIARTLTDFSFCAYLSDLAVSQDYQRQGIGQVLIQHTREACGPDAKLILLAAPAAASYYSHIGFAQHNSCWTLG